VPTVNQVQQATFSSNGLNTIVLDGGGINFLNKSNQSESVTIGQETSNQVITTSAAADNFVVRGSGHTVNAGAGNDGFVIENASNGRFNGEAGDDTFDVRGVNWGSYLSGGAGFDTVRFAAGPEVYHVRDRGTYFDFVKQVEASDGASKTGSVVRVGKDVERFEFAGGPTLTSAQLIGLAAAGGQLQPTAPLPNAINGTVPNGTLTIATALDDRITIGSTSTVRSGAGNDTITDTKGFWNDINTGTGDDVVSSAGDWVSRTDLGDGDDRLNLGLGGGAGVHDGGSGEDTLKLIGADFVVRARQGGGFHIERGKAASSNFVNFERFELGGRTYTAAELGTAVSEAGGRLVLGVDRNQFGSTGSDTLTIANGQWAAVYAGLGDDVINLSGHEVRGDGGAGNDVFHISNSRTQWNRVTANGGLGDDTFYLDDRANQAATNLYTLNGGQGNDVAVFARKASEYRLTEVAGNTVTLTHIASGARSRLTDIESLQFEGGTRYALSALQTMFSTTQAQTLRGEISIRLKDLATKRPEEELHSRPEPGALSTTRGTTSRNQGDQTMSAPTVSTSSNGLTAISSGIAVVLLKDLRDGGSAVDQVVVTSQNDAQVYGGTIGDTETILTGEWGDPHVRNQVYTGASNTGLTQALNALKIDADDGRIDNLENYNKVVAMLTNAAESGAGGRTAEIMDLQADHVLVNGSMRIAVDVESLNDEVAFAENAKITFADGSEKTITNIWNRTGSDGALGVRESETGDGGTSRGTFVVTSADEMGHQGSTHVFGAAHGSISKYVLDVKGTFRGEYGSAGQFWARDDEVAELGFGSVAFWDRYNRKADDESAERARP
jgi:hypothetical protein